MICDLRLSRSPSTCCALCPGPYRDIENPADLAGFSFSSAQLFFLRHTMTTEQQALAEMPIWLVIVLALVGGVSGEMWRADKDGARGWALLRRLALRSGACIVCGVSAMMLMIGAGMTIWTAGSLGCLTAMAGADVAIGLYERWAAKRLGVSDVPPASGEQG
jgi:Kef-type K+ transport system membrane component KefB